MSCVGVNYCRLFVFGSVGWFVSAKCLVARDNDVKISDIKSIRWLTIKRSIRSRVSQHAPTMFIENRFREAHPALHLRIHIYANFPCSHVLIEIHPSRGEKCFRRQNRSPRGKLLKKVRMCGECWRRIRLRKGARCSTNSILSWKLRWKPAR